MNRAIVVGAMSLLLSVPAARAEVATTSPAATTRAAEASATARLVAAANAFLATLDDAQRARVVFRFDDDRQRARWSNFPVGFVPRGGLSLQELSESQRAAAMAVLAAALSPRGYEKVVQIMAGDEYLKVHGDGGRGPGGGGRRGPGGDGPGGRGGPGGGMQFGADLYYLSFLGAPSATEPWMFQFGGHHLALNLTVVGDRGTLAPSLTAAQPARFELDGKTVRPLGAESDKGLALVKSLDDAQRKRAILDYRVGDLVLGPGRDGQRIQPEGLRADALNDPQRALLLDVVAEWANLASDGYAAARMAEIEADLDETYFAWSGPTSAAPGQNITAYYRIQGPRVVIEYAPQNMGGDPSLHVHTIYRDPTNDYGRAMTQR